MATTFTKTIEWSAGGLRTVAGIATLDGVTSGAVQIMEYIQGMSVTPSSIDTTLAKHQITKNIGSAGTAINGMLRIVTGTAGDSFEVVAFGR